MYHSHRWTAEKIAQRIDLVEPLVYRRRIPLPEWRILPLSSPSDGLPAPEGESVWERIPVNATWGGPRLEFALRTRFTVPTEWAPGSAALYLPIGIANDFSHPETLAHIDGLPVSSVDRHHQEVRVPAQYCDGRSHVLTLRGWCGGVRADPAFKLVMRACELVQVDQAARDFHALARVAHGIAVVLDENHPSYGQLLTSLDNAFKQLDIREPFGEAFYASLPAAFETLRSGVDNSGEALPVQITAAGHAHIDVAWLWTLGQTRRKTARTFYNVMRLSEQFPDFSFTQSQPQLYDYIRQDDPALFEQIKVAVDRGAWEPIGGMWVEADCNLSGGESLARQFLLGREFFRRHFGAGADSPVLWLPDVFGYAWNLPQLIKEAGLEYFFTIKLGWNQYNRLPYDSFWWQGLDGTRVLTHFSTTPETPANFRATYNGKATPQQIMHTWTNATQKDSAQPGVYPPLLISYGHGDGGGGPTREMLENIRLLGGFPGAPSVHFGKVKDFFGTLERDLGTHLPTWNGELYLELHRGTYTSQARNKRANRQSEFALHDAEFLAALTARLDPTYPYPAGELPQAWEWVCLNQFHDIIPGSSIGQVYVESLEQYAALGQIVRAVRDDALSLLRARAGAGLLVVNPTSFPRREPAFWPTQTPGIISRPDGSPVLTQPIANGLLFDPGSLPPYSLQTFALSQAPIRPNPPTPFPAGKGESQGSGDLSPSLKGGGQGAGLLSLQISRDCLENAFLRVEFNPAGDITRIYDKPNRREVLPAGAIANQMQAFEDLPRKWDAWDVDIFYDDKQWLAEPADEIWVVESGPLRAALEIRRRLLNSTLVQRISLSAFSPRLDFETSVDWRERHIFLKTAFPVDVLASEASYEIQWGNVQRPTHRNTSWDWARFETCAQKWVDLSEGGYGVSLLNDSKYGHDIRDNVLRLSLLRAPTNPDPDADQGEHHFTYSLYPHAGGWDENTPAQAYFLNDPLIVAGPELDLTPGDGLPAPEGEPPQAAHPAGVAYLAELAARPALALPPQPPAAALPETLSVFALDAPNVILETVKAAEDGRGVILRLYESQRKRGPVTLTCALPLTAAWRANLLEEDQEALPVSGNTLTFPMRPYQILTLRLAW
ncbi:MAG: alpha-mannosidase [Desulfobacterales bacterium]|nr:alpha-mannosidase [Desulfobacterales bacterium]